MKIVDLIPFILKFRFIWNSGGGPNRGGNWTIIHVASCAVLSYSYYTTGGILKTGTLFHIWPQAAQGVNGFK